MKIRTWPFKYGSEQVLYFRSLQLFSRMNLDAPWWRLFVMMVVLPVTPFSASSDTSTSNHARSITVHMVPPVAVYCFHRDRFTGSGAAVFAGHARRIDHLRRERQGTRERKVDGARASKVLQQMEASADVSRGVKVEPCPQERKMASGPQRRLRSRHAALQQ